MSQNVVPPPSDVSFCERDERRPVVDPERKGAQVNVLTAIVGETVANAAAVVGTADTTTVGAEVAIKVGESDLRGVGAMVGLWAGMVGHVFGICAGASVGPCGIYESLADTPLPFTTVVPLHEPW